MDNLQKFTAQVRNHILFVLLLNNVALLAAWWLGTEVFAFSNMLMLTVLAVMVLFLSVVLAWLSAQYITKPTRIIAQAIMHVAPDAANVPAPDQKDNTLGIELVGNLVSHVYQFASVVADVEHSAGKQAHDLKTDFVANSLPLPLLILDKDQTILFANQAAYEYLRRIGDELAGQNLYSVLDMSFASDNTFDSWLNAAKTNKAVAAKTWERVRLNLPDQKTTLQFDLAAYYNRNNPEGFESMLVLFDHTLRYEQDDQGLGLVALAVHELRSPVTVLRGYIEALEEELASKPDPELTDFMHKMKASAQKLTTFINNILNVARVDNDQLTLKLHEENWADIVRASVDDLALRANVQGIELQTEVAADLPSVGVDKVSVYEVITNLLDNAIKYSGQSKKIMIKSYLTSDGLVATTVQDSGVGIPISVMPNLFDKFYRSHHSKTQIGGTGLGLYLSKAIIEAHGGQIWVQSKEGQGSTFGFTVVPYAKLTDDQKSDNKDIVRGAHGWIKNHSLYRG